MRTFIAVGITDDIRKNIAGVQSELKKHDVNIKWVKPENIHITLKFLGEIEEGKINEIYENIKVSVDDIERFSISVEEAGAFPSLKSPRVVWVGVSEGSQRLVILNQRIENALASIGFEKEKRAFSAHITIGRIRSSKNVKLLAERIGDMKKVSLGRALIENILVMKSNLTPRGPVYSVLKKVELK